MPTQNHDYIISLGSNIDPEKNLLRAQELIAKDHDWQVASSIILTKPVGYQDQADFLNSAAAISSKYDYLKFRKYLKEIEQQLGRIKTKIKSGPRTIDLDIVYHNGNLIDQEAMTQSYVFIPINELLLKLKRLR